MIRSDATFCKVELRGGDTRYKQIWPLSSHLERRCLRDSPDLQWLWGGGVRNELDVLGHAESRGCCWYHNDPSLSQPVQVHLITILLIVLESTFHYWESNFLLRIKEIPKMYKRILQTRMTWNSRTRAFNKLPPMQRDPRQDWGERDAEETKRSWKDVANSIF